MTLEVKVPMLAESVPDATLLEWRKNVGDAVERDEILIELETDKVVLEVPAPQSGVLREIVKQTGDRVVSDDVLARIDTSASAPAKGDGAAAPADDESPDDEKEPQGRAAEERSEPSTRGVAKADEERTEASRPADLSPSVRRLVEEEGLDPSRIRGSGRGGRITKGDVLDFLEKRATPATAGSAKRGTAGEPAGAREQGREGQAGAPPSPPSAAPSRSSTAHGRGERREPLSRLRQRIAERLVEAQHTSAILTTFNEVNMGPVMALRNRHKERFEQQHGARLGFMSFFAKAAVQALRRFPAVNAYIEGAEIVYHDYCDIGIAVGSPRGLVVPILRDVENLGFADIETRIAELGERAKKGSLTIEDMTGGTFTISNGGVFGSLLSTPILNPPQSAILGMHKTEDRPVVEDGQIVIRPMMYLALSYDHRIVDGREAVLFLVTIKQAIEDPARLLLDV